jgi:hypothetical protein
MSARIQQLSIRVGTLAALLASVSCGNVVREGRSPAFLVLDSLRGSSGSASAQFTVPLASDVLTKGAIDDDLGQATLRIVLKDQGTPGAGTTPSAVNSITVTGYHVEFERADGRNTPGVDVPYPFDGGVTATITPTPIGVVFELVRHNAKLEAPLSALVSHGGRAIISTVAHVTFFGHDLVGNDVQVTGNISVNFADFADPE